MKLIQACKISILAPGALRLLGCMKFYRGISVQSAPDRYEWSAQAIIVVTEP
jgi:hypothetical protein